MKKKFSLIGLAIYIAISGLIAQSPYSSAEEQLGTMLSKLNFDSITSFSQLKQITLKTIKLTFKNEGIFIPIRYFYLSIN